LERRSLNTQEYVNYLVGEIEAWGKVMSPQSSLLLWKFLNYLMAVCKEKDIVTGVGRGSSVSSLTLYLLGVHAVDPVKYKLNYEEFLR
jgi:DNA polymerase-3 subunit alpha